jgi:ParB family chromosome partitioning protein
MENAATAPAELQATETTLALKLIEPNPDQPRKLFDQGALDELAANIRQYGVLQPLVVTRRGRKYMIVAGERRWRACLQAGLKYVPVRVIEADDQAVDELALLENLLRKDLNVVEEARAFQTLLDRGLSEEELAAKLGFKQTWRIGERTSLLNLAEEYQQLVIKGQLGNSQAFEMSRLPRGQQPLVFRKINCGELNSYAKLRAFVDGLLNVEQTAEMFSSEEVTPEDRATLTKLEKMLEQVARVIGESYKDNELVALKKMRRGNLEVNIQRIELIEQSLAKVKKAMTAAAMQHAALDLAG